ncbi:MAG: heme-binding domain-containing protein [Ferruginibacter sp.]
MKKVLKKIGIALLLVFGLVQFYPRPEKNKGIASNDISVWHSVPPNVKELISTACYNCHSNTTKYPWYANIQPVAWWLNEHVEDGKKELNFSEFGNYTLARQFHKLEEVTEMIETNEMPLQSYSIIHSDAKLSAEQKQVVLSWAADIRQTMKNKYPADSLIRKKK